jgi:predicted kinase
MFELRTDRALLVVTGIQAAGKSTVARELAARFRRGVHVEADALQRMIISGAEGVRGPGPPAGEAAQQLRLRLRHMCLLGRSFFDNGFTAVLDDIIIGERWAELQEELAGYTFTLVVLAPRVEVVAGGRDLARTKRPLGPAWATYLDEELRRTMAGVGVWVDSSEQTPEQTADEILAHLPPANRDAS